MAFVICFLLLFLAPPLPLGCDFDDRCLSLLPVSSESSALSFFSFLLALAALLPALSSPPLLGPRAGISSSSSSDRRSLPMLLDFAWQGDGQRLGEMRHPKVSRQCLQVWKFEVIAMCTCVFKHVSNRPFKESLVCYTVSSSVRAH